tara:strand:+ start:99 stop:401 length:303 start_codon:yes stop_codon:yes gene_type:complete
MTDYRKCKRFITFNTNREIWGILDDLHKKYGVNKATFIRNYLEWNIKHKKDFLIGAYSEEQLEKQKLFKMKIRKEEHLETIQNHMEKINMLCELIEEDAK